MIRQSTIDYLNELAVKNALLAAQNAAESIDIKRKSLSPLLFERNRIQRKLDLIDRRINSIKQSISELKVVEDQFRSLHLSGSNSNN